jgi:integrase
MPRPAREPRIYWKSSHNCWYVNLKGRQTRLDSDEATARQKFHEIMAGKARQPEQPAPGRRSVVVTEIVNKFLDWCREHRAKDTYDWYAWRLEAFDREVAKGVLTVAELKPFHLDDWLKQHTEWSSGMKHGVVRAVMRCLRWAERRGRIERSPLAGYEKPRAGKRTVVVSEEEYAEMLAFIPQQEFKDLVVVTWETGCRPQESLVVEARHVDLVAGRWAFPPEESKGEEMSRVVYLTPAALEITRRLMERWPTGPIFRNSEGLNPWTTDAVNCAFQRLRLAVGMKRLKEQGLAPGRAKRLQGNARTDVAKRTEHARLLKERRKATRALAKKLAPKRCLYHLRHTWLNRALKAGIDPLTAATLMGHKNPGTIAKVYQHLAQDPEFLARQARKVNGADA